MGYSHYEKISIKDPNFPIIFYDVKNSQNRTTGFYLHWHENVEILYFTGGTNTLQLNNHQIQVQKGDLIVINSNTIHSMPSKPVDCTYYCLIIDKLFCDSYFIPFGDLLFEECIRDPNISNWFEKIINEMTKKDALYKSMVKAYVVSLLVHLSREHSYSNVSFHHEAQNNKLKMVKKSLTYMSAHFTEPLSVDDIAQYVGFSKYYFCHVFKELTGQTVLDYINVLRCSHAKKLLQSGNFNISESALESGFQNLSYFTKTYKKYMGCLPSKEVIEHSISLSDK